MAPSAALQNDQDDHLTGELSCSAAVARHIADGCLADGPVGRVGLEIEAHCFDLADPLRRPGWDELNGALKWLRSLPGGSAITLEPGGAVELSGPPADGVVAAIAAMQQDQAVICAFPRMTAVIAIGAGLGKGRDKDDRTNVKRFRPWQAWQRPTLPSLRT